MSNLPNTTIAQWLRNILGSDVDLNILDESEERIAKAYKQYLSGYKCDLKSLIKIVIDDYQGNAIIEQKDIPFYSFCSHHFLPFFGTLSIRYSPRGKIIGLGKMPRIVNAFTARFTMQEIMNKEICEFLFEALEAEWVEVSSNARHLCVESRGPHAIGSSTEVYFRCNRQ